MKKTIHYKILANNETLELEISTHKDFVDCIEKHSPPFFGNKNILFVNPELQIEQYEVIVIKCFIAKEERSKVLNWGDESSMNISYKVIDEFIAENWNNGEQLVEIENLSCNHYEIQIKYAITK